MSVERESMRDALLSGRPLPLTLTRIYAGMNDAELEALYRARFGTDGADRSTADILQHLDTIMDPRGKLPPGLTTDTATLFVNLLRQHFPENTEFHRGLDTWLGRVRQGNHVRADRRDTGAMSVTGARSSLTEEYVQIAMAVLMQGHTLTGHQRKIVFNRKCEQEGLQALDDKPRREYFRKAETRLQESGKIPRKPPRPPPIALERWRTGCVRLQSAPSGESSARNRRRRNNAQAPRTDKRPARGVTLLERGRTVELRPTEGASLDTR